MEDSTNCNAGAVSMDDGDAASSAPVMVGSLIPGSVAVSVHPLVLLNVSDHWTRMRTQQAEANTVQAVFGAIIGKQMGREVEIMNSFELKYQLIDGAVVLNKDYYRAKEEQYKQVFSEMSLLGWYTTGAEPTDNHIQIHKQVNELVESPLLLKLNPALPNNVDLGVEVYESVVVGANSTAIMLVRLPYTLATEEAERVGVDHVARMASNQSTECSNVSDQLRAQSSAVRMLEGRVRLVAGYVRAVQAGELPLNHSLLRQVSALQSRLPLLDTEAIGKQFYTQSNDTALLTYLCSLTKSCNSANKFLTRFNMCHERNFASRKLKTYHYY